jgi:hypothetical protein
MSPARAKQRPSASIALGAGAPGARDGAARPVSPRAAMPWRPPHIRFFTPQKLATMVREAGFAYLTVRGTTDAPLLAPVPVLNRLSRGEASDLYRFLVDQSTSLVAPGLLALARKERGTVTRASANGF